MSPGPLDGSRRAAEQGVQRLVRDDLRPWHVPPDQHHHTYEGRVVEHQPYDQVADQRAEHPPSASAVGRGHHFPPSVRHMAGWTTEYAFLRPASRDRPA